MCKVLMINGSPHEHGCTYTALHEVEIKLNEHQIATEMLYLTISNMPVVPSQFWNLVHGHTPEDVSNDAIGMQTMRALSENIAWLLKIKEAGRAIGVSNPNYESGFCNNTQKDS